MKIAITATETGLGAKVDPRFGRAPGFMVVENEDKSFEYVSNTANAGAAQGAGIAAAQTVANAGAGAVITGHCGPKAFAALQAANIAVYTTTAATVEEALAEYNEGKLQALTSSDKAGHWA